MNLTRTLCIMLMSTICFAAPQDENAVTWQKTLTEIVQTKDDALAREKIAALEKTLQSQSGALAKVRLGELLVRAKLPRAKGMAQGMIATRAIRHWEEALKIEPDNVDALYLHARTCAGMPSFMRKSKDAIRSLERLVTIERNTPGSVGYPQAFALLAQFKRKEADAVIALGLKSFPKDKALQRLKGKSESTHPTPLPTPSIAEAKKAKALFLSSLENNDLKYGLIDRGLKAGESRFPKDYEYPLYRGLLRLWQMETTPGPTLAAQAESSFRRALRMNPDDTRIYGWLGPLLYGTGHAANDAKRIAEGESIMNKGVKLNPEQNLFGRAFGYRITNTHLDRIEDDIYKTMELSCGQPLRRDRFLPGPGQSDHPAMRDSKSAPNNIAGTMYWAGEFFRSRGATIKAEDAFTEALKADAKKTWPYRRLASERLRHIKGENVPLNPNPASCMLCHQAR